MRQERRKAAGNLSARSPNWQKAEQSDRTAGIPEPERLSAAEFIRRCNLCGWRPADFAYATGCNFRRVREWQMGERDIPEWVAAYLDLRREITMLRNRALAPTLRVGQKFKIGGETITGITVLPGEIRLSVDKPEGGVVVILEPEDE